MKEKFVLGENLNPRLFISINNEKIEAEKTVMGDQYVFSFENIKACLGFQYTENGFRYTVKLRNEGNEDFSPETLGLDIGIDTCMAKFPDWNDTYFPTFFRCEKSHFYGLLRKPNGEILGVCCKQPIASYSHNYNSKNGINFGHRIYNSKLDFLNCPPLPKHHPINCHTLKAKEVREYVIDFFACTDYENWRVILAETYGLPMIDAVKFTLEKGEHICPVITCNKEYKTTVILPSGAETTDFTAKDYGLYSLEVETADGFSATANFYCRKPFEWYLKSAREEVIDKMPHATTHCESWYGFFSGFLAAQHYPDSGKDEIINNMFQEIMPLCFDFENIKPKLITERVQNVSAFISVLVARYKSDREKHRESLVLASKFADWLITRQGENGAYYRNGTHYTCVIYPAKSMLELAIAEKELSDDEFFKESYLRHYNSAARAINQLRDALDNIETEGEQTFEDGMISCSAAQLGFFALNLPKDQQEDYTKAAEYMIRLHECLEQGVTPDCRARSTSIRYWEAQYDVLLMSNFHTSPHGWSGWLSYAYYYLYLLTAKKEYLIKLMNSLGACVQLMTLDGKLRWAFAVDPYIPVKRRLFKDESDIVKSTYNSGKSTQVGYRGIFKEDVVGEEYIDMISGWYQTDANQKVTGGYYTCPLFLEDQTLRIDNQGGCCDNDVHEIFKCLEETVLKKAFIHQNDDGSFLCYGCTVQKQNDVIIVDLNEFADIVVFSANSNFEALIDGKIHSVRRGINTINC